MKFENLEVVGWKQAIRKSKIDTNEKRQSDSGLCSEPIVDCEQCYYYDKETGCTNKGQDIFVVGPLDYKTLLNDKDDEFKRMIIVYVEVTATVDFWEDLIKVIFKDNKINPFVMFENVDPHIHRYELILNYGWLSHLYHMDTYKDNYEWQEFKEWIASLPYSDIITK